MAALFMDNNFTARNSQQTGWVFFDGHVEINTEAEEDKSKFKLRMQRQQIQSGFVIYFEVKAFMDMLVCRSSSFLLPSAFSHFIIIFFWSHQVKTHHPCVRLSRVAQGSGGTSNSPSSFGALR